MRQVAGQRAQVAFRGQDFGEARDLAGVDRRAAHGGFGGEKRRDGLLALFRFQRAGAIDQGPARPEQRDRLLQQALLQRRQRADIGSPAAARRHRDDGGWCRSRCRAHRPGCRRSLRRSLPPCHSAASATTVSASSESRARLSRSRAMRPGERSTAVTRAPAWASCAVLPPGAAQRSAMDLPATSPNRRAGNAAAASCTHHWPSVKPGSIVTEPCSSVRTVPVGSVSPCRRVAHCAAIGFHGDIERGLVADRNRDVARDALAVMRDPARQQPRRNIERLRLDLVDQRLSLARAAAQHRIDEPGIFRGAPVRLHQPHRQIDRGVIGHVHPENLRGADQERALRARRVGRNAAIEQPRQHMAERAEPPQDRRHQPPHQRAVAIGQRLQSGMRAGAVELLVERAVLMQHAVENIRRDPPRRETGHLGWQCESLRRHGAGTSRKDRDSAQRFASCHRKENTFGTGICQI